VLCRKCIQDFFKQVLCRLFNFKTIKDEQAGEMDFLAHQDDEYVNELATDWYFPDLFFNKAVLQMQSVLRILVD
jgi:hypothetical protein